VVMLATVAVLQGSGRRWPWPWVLAAAAVVVTVLDPWALLQPGFWLSFMAVGLLMASEPVHVAQPLAPTVALGRWRRWRLSAVAGMCSGMRTQVVATLGLAPLTLLCFAQVSAVGFGANLVAIPVVTLVVTPLALMGVLWPALWSLGAAVVQQMAAAMQWLAAWPGAVLHVAAAPGWAQLAGLLAAALLVMPLPWRLRCLSLPLVLPMLWPPLGRPPHGQFELVAVDVGQGTAVLVRTQEHLLVFDAGPQYALDSDAGQRVLLPLLHARGERRIDRLVLSHRDIDHVGGASAMLQGLPVTDLLSSLEDGHRLLTLAQQQNTAALRCAQGQGWEWDGVRFEILHPMERDYAVATKPNAISCVLKVSAAQGSALLTGDIEKAQEARLVATQAPLKSDILVVPHHGSKTSSTADFLDAVQPQLAVVQAGYWNRYGHPVPQVLARIHERGIALRLSPTCGAWQWRSGEAASGVCQRQQALRYWHHTQTSAAAAGD
jgi:competence protein ComEC